MSCSQTPGISPPVGVLPGPAAAPVTGGTPLPDACLRKLGPVRVLAGLRAELAARGLTPGGMVATRLQATLDLPGGLTVTCRGGWLSWPAPAPGGSAHAVHWVGDMAGAAGRLARAADG
jgi:hypothetical protein